MGRAPCCEKVGLKKGRWTEEEDEILTKYILANGEGSWRSLPKNAGLLRCGKSCRLRWINYLRADLKRGNISVEEENTIVKLHASFGNRWSLIASHLPGRTDNEIKNYWNSHLSRKIYSTHGTTHKEIITLPPKRRCGRTTRLAMKNNITSTQQNRKPIDHNIEAVPLPPTPTLESENLSSTISDFMVWDPEMEELDDGKEGNYALGPCEDVINEDEVLGFNDILDSCFPEAGGDFNFFGENGECKIDAVENDEGNEIFNTYANNVEEGQDKESSGKQSSNNESGESHSCSSIVSGLDDNWDWESLMQLDRKEEWEEHNENLLTWLWKDEDWVEDFQSLGEIDSDKQDDMVAWLLS